MNILLAEQDRDFLLAYSRLLSGNGHNVISVFDGTQALCKLREEQIDLIIIDERLPRVSADEITRSQNRKKIPVIVILKKKINTGILIRDDLASAYLSLPFLPGELNSLIESINEKCRSQEKLIYEDVSFDISDFLLCGKLRVTNEEIDIFRSLINEKELDNKRAGPYINALNFKLQRLEKKPRIEYILHKGYRLVMIRHE